MNVSMFGLQWAECDCWLTFSDATTSANAGQDIGNYDNARRKDDRARSAKFGRARSGPPPPEPRAPPCWLPQSVGGRAVTGRFIPRERRSCSTRVGLRQRCARSVTWPCWRCRRSWCLPPRWPPWPTPGPFPWLSPPSWSPSSSWTTTPPLSAWVTTKQVRRPTRMAVCVLDVTCMMSEIIHNVQYKTHFP